MIKSIALALTVGTLQLQANPAAAIKTFASKITPAHAAGIATGLGCGILVNHHVTEMDKPQKTYEEKTAHTDRAFTWAMTSWVGGGACSLSGREPIKRFGGGLMVTLAGLVALKTAAYIAPVIVDNMRPTDIIEKDLKPIWNNVKASVTGSAESTK